MGEQVRGVAAEKTYNRRWLHGADCWSVAVGSAGGGMDACDGGQAAGRTGVPLERPGRGGRLDVPGRHGVDGRGNGCPGCAHRPDGVCCLRTQTLLVARIGVGFGLAFGVAVGGLVRGRGGRASWIWWTPPRPNCPARSWRPASRRPSSRAARGCFSTGPAKWTGGRIPRCWRPVKRPLPVTRPWPLLHWTGQPGVKPCGSRCPWARGRGCSAWDWAASLPSACTSFFPPWP